MNTLSPPPTKSFVWLPWFLLFCSLCLTKKISKEEICLAKRIAYTATTLRHNSCYRRCKSPFDSNLQDLLNQHQSLDFLDSIPGGKGNKYLHILPETFSDMLQVGFINATSNFQACIVKDANVELIQLFNFALRFWILHFIVLSICFKWIGILIFNDK